MNQVFTLLFELLNEQVFKVYEATLELHRSIKT